MLNLRARQYEPQMMRFAQKDLVRGSAIEPISLNRYLYCQDNPIDFSDPSGLTVWSKIKSAAKSVVKTAVATTVKAAASAVSTAAKVTSAVSKGVSAVSKVVAKASTAVSNVAAKVAASSSNPTLKKLATSVSNSAAKVSKAATTVSKAANKVATVATKVAQKADAITKMSTDQIVSGVKSVATSVAKTVATTVKSAVNTVVSCAKAFYENTVQPALDVAVSFYNQHSDLIHTGLDIIGSLPIPYVSTIADGVNAALYLCEGNYIEAATSALNMLPGGGVAGKIKKVGEKCIDIINVGRSVKNGDYLGAIGGALSILPVGKRMSGGTGGNSNKFNLIDDTSITSKSDANLLEKAEKFRDDLIDSTPGGKTKAVVIGAYDIKRGAVTADFAGPIPDEISDVLTERGNKIGGIGSLGVTDKNTVGVCAEFRAANQLLLDGSNISDIRFTSPIRPRTGEILANCDNCVAMFFDIL